MKESIPTPISQETVIETLRSKKLEDPEAKQLYINWLIQEEAVANEVNSSRANIVVNVERAFVLASVGYTEEALETYEEARLQAHQENETDLYDLIMGEMDRLEDVAE